MYICASIRMSTLAFVMMTLAACNLEHDTPVSVVVYPTIKRCAIKEQPVDCGQLGIYLRDTLKIDANRRVDVSVAGTDPISKDDKSIDRIADLIRAAGYKDVRALRFGL